jgi:hypothetical protein
VSGTPSPATTSSARPAATAGQRLTALLAAMSGYLAAIHDAEAAAVARLGDVIGG